MRFDESVVEEFSGINVDDMLQLRKNSIFYMLLHNMLVRLGLPSEFVVDNET